MYLYIDKIAIGDQFLLVGMSKLMGKEYSLQVLCFSYWQIKISLLVIFITNHNTTCKVFHTSNLLKNHQIWRNLQI